MNKSVRTIALLSVTALIFLIQSCLSTDEPEVRTSETEIEELAQILQTLENKGYDIDTTASGLYYIIHTQGSGAFPQEGDSCYVEYATYFIDGTLLDASAMNYTDAIWKMKYQKDSTITGFYESLGLMNKGTEADFIIPSKLAYGPYGYGVIPAYTPLLFSIKLHDLIPVTE